MAKIKCPECGSTEIIPIMYGYPGDDAMQDYLDGKVKLGGCCIYDNQPTRHCKECKHDFAPRKLQ